MKSIITKEIDGYKIVVGITGPTIDPVATTEAVRPILAASDEIKALSAEAAKVEAERTRGNEAFIAASKAMRAGKDAERQRLELDVKTHAEAADKLMGGLAPLVEALEAKRRALTVEHAVYFEPRANEVHVSDEEAQAMVDAIAAKQDHELITIDGTPIDNFKGVVYWRKTEAGWLSEEIGKIGIAPPMDSTMADDLTAEQRQEIVDETETDRIAALSAADRKAEKAARLDALATQAATRRSADEIKGMSAKDALAASKAWYEKQAQAVEDKYK